MDNVRIIFILPSKYSHESEASDIMKQAFEACKQNVQNVIWVKDSKYESIELAKTDFVIFEEFEGVNFEKLKESKCARILGPWCVAICLMEGKQIPNFPWPIYNVAMYDCIVSCSYLPKKLKHEIKEKVQKMGGCYSETLVSTNTHLVTDSVQTEKYSHAAEMGAKIMLPDWVNAVWEASESANIHCNDQQFAKYKVPPFHNLTMCSTGFTKQSEKNELKNLISENGGTLTGNLKLSSTAILVCKGVEGTTSEKYKAARKSANIKCVTIDWIKDSIKKGYALPDNLYQVKKGQSTPTKGNESINPNFSMMSVIIPNEQGNKTTLEDTLLPSTTRETLNRTKGTKRKELSSNEEEYEQLVDNLDIKKAKRSGQYLDGCSVYVAGFGNEHREKLCKILNLSGATRYDDINDRVTHVIVGDIHCPDVKIIKNRGYSCALVSIKWLIESIEKQQAANEEEFLMSISESHDRSDFSSPLSKKGLKLLRSEKTITEKDMSDEMEPPQQPVEETDIIQQYLGKLNTAQEDTLAQLLKSDMNFKSTKEPETTLQKPLEQNTQQSTVMTEDETSQPCDIFEGIKFLLVGFNLDQNTILKEQIENVSGEVVTKSYKGIADFAVVPVFNSAELHNTTSEVVNDLWIAECIQEGELREVLYYHKPFLLQDANVLKNCVITCSGYHQIYERNFLRTLIETLGGISQDQFARITSVEKNIVGSTHLISQEPSGKKYMAALKWGLPVVNTNWLLECARTGTLVLEKDYLLGDAKAPERPNVAELSAESTITMKSSDVSSTGNKIATPKGNTLKSKIETSTTENNTSTPKNISYHQDNRVLTPLMEKVNDINPETPINKNLNLSSAGCSQVTPVHKIMEELRKTNLLGTPENSPLPYDNYFNIKTPDTPLERFLTPNPNKELRKQLQRYINQFPDFIPPQRRLSTPLSELKKKLWNKIGFGDSEAETEPKKLDFENEEESQLNEVFEEPKLPNPVVSNKLQLLEDMLSNNSTGNKRASRNFQSTVPTEVANAEIKDSQVFTVGWDYREFAAEEPQKQSRIFIFSGVDNDMRQHYTSQLESLGATVSESLNYDPSCTHLLCPRAQRNEKSLSCMAAGKWVLHISYIDKSVAAGTFLNEEEFEYGNPKSRENIPRDFDKEVETRVSAMHWWRKEISRRGYGAFNDMRAIVVASKRDSFVKVLEAGGAVVLDMSPPFDDTVAIHATHCLLEYRTIGIDKLQDYIPLAKQGIYCVNTVYLSEFLHRTSKDIRDCIIPSFAKYYSKKSY